MAPSQPPSSIRILLLTTSLLLALLSFLAILALVSVVVYNLYQLPIYLSRYVVVSYVPHLICNITIQMIANYMADEDVEWRWGGLGILCLSLVVIGIGVQRCLRKRWDGEIGGRDVEKGLGITRRKRTGSGRTGEKENLKSH